MMNDDRILIRRAVATDMDALVGLLGQLFGIERDFAFDAGTHRRGLEALLDDSDGAWVWVALVGDAVAGMCTTQRLVSTAMGAQVLHIEDVVVDRSHRNTGIASALLAHIENWAVANGFRRLQLIADRANSPALAFYRNRNWEKTNMIWHRKHLAGGPFPDSDGVS